MHPGIRGRIPEVESICRRCGVRRLWLFGSAAGGSFHPAASDLDFLVDFQSLPPGPYAQSYFDLQESLEGLFKIPVDLVELEPIRNPYFLEAVERTRVVVYDAA